MRKIIRAEILTGGTSSHQIANFVVKIVGDLNAPKKSNAFTLAEVLITLAIIGVVAALTIPTVLKNYNDKKYNTARLKALKTFGEAGKLASINGEINGQPTARAFVENVLSKYLKITKVCDNAHPNDCGFPSEIQPSNPDANKLPVDSTHLVKWNQITVSTSNISSPTNDPAMSTIVLTNDGFSAKIFYNPKCGRTSHEIAISSHCNNSECEHYGVDAACMNVIYDMNGIKGPNHVGDDIGIVTVFWSGLKAVSVAPGLAPYDIVKTVYDEGTKSQINAQTACAAASTKKMQLTLGNFDEVTSITLNAYLTSLPSLVIWSGSKNKDGAGYICYSNRRGYGTSPCPTRAWCVRR